MCEKPIIGRVDYASWLRGEWSFRDEPYHKLFDHTIRCQGACMVDVPNALMTMAVELAPEEFTKSGILVKLVADITHAQADAFLRWLEVEPAPAHETLSVLIVNFRNMMMERRMKFLPSLLQELPEGGIQ